MVRYFFDVVSRSRSEYDSQGTLLSDTNEARKWARLLAITLRVPNERQEFVDGRVDVRGPDGCELFSIPTLVADHIVACHRQGELEAEFSGAP